MIRGLFVEGLGDTVGKGGEGETLQVFSSRLIGHSASTAAATAEFSELGMQTCD